MAPGPQISDGRQRNWIVQQAGITPESIRSVIEQLRSGKSYQKRSEQHLAELLSKIW